MLTVAKAGVAFMLVILVDKQEGGFGGPTVACAAMVVNERKAKGSRYKNQQKKEAAYFA